MNDHEVEVILTPERIKLYERAMVIGLPAIVVAMYGDRIQKLIDDEREACAMECIKLAHKWTRLGAWGENNEFHDCAAAIRARGQT
jgi:hypothetical protein